MTITPPTRPDPADDSQANYDYQSDDIEQPGLVADLDARIAGEVRGDSYSRQLYATDASIYEVTPIAVVFPRSTDDVASVVSYCADREIPVLPRGGGTSLAGQTVNEAVVLDFTTHMNDAVSIDPDERRATVQSGIVLEKLNEALAPHDLKFAPDPAWGDKSALGGAIGNNTTGAHSLQYGKTDAYVEEVEVVLADGTVTRFGEVDLDELPELADGDDLESDIYAEVAHILDEQGELIEDTYPDLKRNVSGYNLDWLVSEARRASTDASGEAASKDAYGGERGIGEPDSEGGSINLAKLLCGSEGTLAIVTEATVSLEPIPETKSMALLAYDTVLDAMADVEAIVAHDPAAVEVLDDVMIDLARDTPEFAPVTEMLPEGTTAVLIVEFYAEDTDDGKRKVANLLADRCPSIDPEGEADEEADRVVGGDALAFDAIEAYDEASRTKIWKLRKSGLPILLSRTTDEKHVAFIEDTGIPPANLRAFVADFQDVLEAHDTYASFYAHAGPGVLHIRPLVNTKTEAGLEMMESIADDVTDLVVEYDGSISGEHGDGRARTQWNRKLYGEELWETFQDLKSAFDPDWLLNPGQVVFRDDNPTDMTENHRFGPDYEFDAGFEPSLEWDNEQGFQGMAELCHGCGGCRGDQSTTGGVMCPTFRASHDEILSTRGRANMLRQAMSGELSPGEQFDDEFVEEVLDLCIGCKGCKHDCPSGVDMAKLKAELTYEHHRRNGTAFRDRLFANFETLAKLGSATAPVSNIVSSLPGTGILNEKLLGISRERDLPTFHRETFARRVTGYQPAVSAGEATCKVVLVPDIYTNHEYPDAGIAALTVLEAAGVHVEIADPMDVGRPAYSKGMLGKAAKKANDVVHELHPRVTAGYDVVLIEPSDAVMVQSDYLSLFDHPEVNTVALNTYGICEYLDQFDLDAEIEFQAPDDHLVYHGHCHQKAHAKDHHAVGVLRRAGYAVDPLDSSCCGMAGSFGYEAEHYSMSQAIGEVLVDQVTESEGDRVVAPGASCRTQLDDLGGASEEPPTPIEVVAEAIDTDR